MHGLIFVRTEKTDKIFDRVEGGRRLYALLFLQIGQTRVLWKLSIAREKAEQDTSLIQLFGSKLMKAPKNN